MCVFIVMAVFTTSGTFMLLFLAALQSIDDSVNEAAALDGATEWRKFRYITVPMIRPMIFTVVTLGLIGTWQIFDQIYVGTKGSPSNTTLTPAFLSFNSSFNGNEWGVGAAIAFILFAIIVFFTIVTRLRDAQSRPRPAPAPLRADAAARLPRRIAHRIGRARERTVNDASAVRRRRLRTGLSYGVLVADRGRLHLPLRDRGRDVLQDGAGRDGQSARPHSLPVHDGGVQPALHGSGLPALGEELRDRDAQRHVLPRLPRQPRRLCACAPALPWARRRVHDDRRRHGGARGRAPHPEVPDDPPARDLRHVPRHDHPAARRRRRHLHHEELLRVDPA